ncbi:putative heat-labile enterotoxin [Ophiocordyceps camponoti-floridani]|uniref:Putative heat-labile enterotoxin n=1 Tax=Ophiocordyceps camponoti-floridani TaxID=2030778 RepID=A0A8H4Q489_9HYPO|nr:putative heat-labile enterotoxin [Ophiocordyceps camponoti-floridani]
MNHPVFQNFRLTVGLTATYLRITALAPALKEAAKASGINAGAINMKFKTAALKTGIVASKPLYVDFIFNLPFYVQRLRHIDWNHTTVPDVIEDVTSIVPIMRCTTKVVAAHATQRMNLEMVIDTPFCLVGDALLFTGWTWTFPLALLVMSIRRTIQTVFVGIRGFAAVRERQKSVEQLREERTKGWNEVVEKLADRVLSDEFKTQVVDLFTPVFQSVTYSTSELARNLLDEVFVFERKGRAIDGASGFKADLEDLNLLGCEQLNARAHVFAIAAQEQLRIDIQKAATLFDEEFFAEYKRVGVGDQKDEYAWCPPNSTAGRALVRMGLKEAWHPATVPEYLEEVSKSVREQALFSEDDPLQKFREILQAKSGKSVQNITDEAIATIYPRDPHDCSDRLWGSSRKALASVMSQAVDIVDNLVDCSDEVMGSDPHVMRKVASGQVRCGNATHDWSWLEKNNVEECQTSDSGERLCQTWVPDSMEPEAYQRAERSGILDMREPEEIDLQRPLQLDIINCRGRSLGNIEVQQKRIRRGLIGCAVENEVWYWSHNRLRHCKQGLLECDSWDADKLPNSARLSGIEAGILTDTKEAWSATEVIDCSVTGLFKNLTLLAEVEEGRIACRAADGKWLWSGTTLLHCKHDEACQILPDGEVPPEVEDAAIKAGAMSQIPQNLTDCHDEFFTSGKALDEDFRKGRVGCGYETDYWVWNEDRLWNCHGGLRKPCGEYSTGEALDKTQWPKFKMPAAVEDCRTISMDERKAKSSLMWWEDLGCGSPRDFWFWNDEKIRHCRKGADNSPLQCSIYDVDDERIKGQAEAAGLMTNRPKPRGSQTSPRPFRWATKPYWVSSCSTVGEKEVLEMRQGKLACGSRQRHWGWKDGLNWQCQSREGGLQCATYETVSDSMMEEMAKVGLVTNSSDDAAFRIRDCKRLPKDEMDRHFDEMWAGKLGCGHTRDYWRWTASLTLSYRNGLTQGGGDPSADWKIEPHDEDNNERTQDAQRRAASYGIVSSFKYPSEGSFGIIDCNHLPPERMKKNEDMMWKGNWACRGDPGFYWRWIGPETLMRCPDDAVESRSCVFANIPHFSRPDEKSKQLINEASASGIVTDTRSRIGGDDVEIYKAPPNTPHGSTWHMLFGQKRKW